MAISRVIVPRADFLNTSRLPGLIETALDAASEGILADFQATTRTWEGRPTFKIERETGKRIISTNSKVYRFLALGTKVRYAVMSKDFRAKTVPDALYSRVGKGGKVLVSKKFPRPGIVARNWHKTVAKKWQKQARIIFQRVINAAAYGEAVK